MLFHFCPVCLNKTDGSGATMPFIAAFHKARPRGYRANCRRLAQKATRRQIDRNTGGNMKIGPQIVAALLPCWVGAALAGEPALEGAKDIVLHTRDGQAIIIGVATFTPNGDETGFKIAFDDKKFAEYFLSMREFKCVEGADILCHVPYPYAHRDSVTPENLSWLEHALLFIYKTPNEYGARMGNGLIYTMKITPEGIVGTPQSIDLDEIAVPPDNLAVAYFGPDHRYDLQPGARWIESLTIGPHR
jgi:hypothetical protein